MAFFRKGGNPTPARTVRLPARGRAIVLSDLHGHTGDWKAFLMSSRLRERLLDGEDLWLLVTGDVPDVVRHRTVDPTVPADGDATILDALIALKAELGERGERVVYLEGNHDFHLCRIAREVIAFATGSEPGPNEPAEALEPKWIDDYFEHYLEQYGERIFANNIGPYDMIRRLRPEHMAFMEGSPILAWCEEAGVAVTHAGPPRMAAWKPKLLQRTIETAHRDQLRDLGPEAYYESPYHQLLNNRFRNGDYSLEDLEAFLALYGDGILITGHTPHPYLVDFESGVPLPGCGFRDGIGHVGGRQVVLCSSFGAFHPALKRYLELDLSKRYRTVEDLFQRGAEVKPIFPVGMPPPAVGALPGAEVILGQAKK